ncbi:hypothetical protein BJY01DRAFT_261381 [Aspergillus pseudoustus]|uniref:RRM domain-containing protein n=1 Tax=Aspergillus pseudoustus TaxID=1810923 RepID=A0ABR4IP99_9EURO
MAAHSQTPNRNTSGDRADERWTNRALESPNWRTRTSCGDRSPASTTDEPPTQNETGQFAPEINPSSTIAEGMRIYTQQKNTNIAIDISIDPFSGRNPSYCFVEFGSKDKADRAPAGLNGTAQRKDAARHFKGYSREGRRLIVKGLPKPTSQAFMNEKLADFFGVHNFIGPGKSHTDTEAISKTICPHYQGRAAPDAPHDAYVDLASASQAQAAMDALDGTVGPSGTVLTLTKATTDWNGP